MWTLNKKICFFGLNQINGYLRRGLHLERFDPSRRFIEPRIWIYAGLHGSNLTLFLETKWAEWQD